MSVLTTSEKASYDVVVAGKSGTYTRISAGTLTLGTGAVLSLADSLFTGKVAGGRGDLQGASGVVGIVAGSFASSGAETGTGAGQAALGAAAAANRPYPVGDFPGQYAYAQCVLLRADREPIKLVDMIAGQITDATAEVYGYLAYRSDLGADAKWRLYFYYRRASDGLEVPFTPTVSLTSCWLEVPEILLSTGRPPGADLSLTVAGPAVSPIPTLDKVPAPVAAVAFNSQKATGLANGAAAGEAATYLQTAPGILSNWGVQKNPANATTRFVPAGSNNNALTAPGTVEADSFIVMPAAGTLTGLYVFTSITIVDTQTFTVRVNGVDTSITCQIAGAGTAANDTAHTAAFSAGDRISIKYVQSSTAAAVNVNMTANLAYRAT